MVDRLRTDESFQVLILVALPLFLLLIVGIFLLIRFRPRLTAEFSNFTVSINRVGREDAYVIYRENGKPWEFYAGPARGKKIYLEAPKELSEQDVRRVVPNLALGLAKLGFQKYSIYKRDESQVIAQGSLQR